MTPHHRPPRRFRPTLVLCLALVLVFLSALPLLAATPPRVSPMGTVGQTVGVSEVEIVYSRPSVRDRVIFGELVPYGEVWRTGANEATTFSLSHDASIEGEPLAAGTYALFTIPGETSWILIFSSQSDLWGAYGRDEAKDVLKVEVEPRAAPFAEMFTITFPEVTNRETGGARATVQLHWADVAVPLRVEFAAEVASEMAAAEISEALAADEVDVRTAMQWTNFLYGAALMLEEAADWAGEIAEAADQDYGAHALHARLLAKVGEHEKAKAAADAALALVPEDASGRLKADADSLRSEMDGWGSED